MPISIIMLVQLFNQFQLCQFQGLLESPTMPWDLSLETLKIADDVRRQIGVVFPSD